MTAKMCVLAGLVLAASASGCGSAEDGGAGGAAGAGSGGVGATSQSGGSSGTGGSSGSSGNGGSSGNDGSSGNGGSSGSGGSSGGSGSAGTGGRADSGIDRCGGCSGPNQICIFQVGGPGPSRFLCAENPPCKAAGVCACIINQGPCSYVPDENDAAFGGMCSCDNGLD